MHDVVVGTVVDDNVGTDNEVHVKEGPKLMGQADARRRRSQRHGCERLEGCRLYAYESRSKCYC